MKYFKIKKRDWKCLLLRLFLILLLPQLAIAQPASFQKIFGEAEKNETGVASVLSADDFIFLLGYSFSDTDDTDGTLSKLDMEGNLIWTENFGTNNDDIPFDLLFNDRGELVVVGETQTNNASDIDAFVFVFDTSGNEIWSEFYGSDDGNNFFRSIKQTTDGGYIICGFTNEQGSKNEYYLVKTDGDGDVEWEQTHGSMQNQVGVAVEVLEDGSYLFIGDKQQSAQGPYGIEAVRIDSMGTILWQTDVNNFSNGGCKSMTQNRAGHFILIGEATPPGQFAFDVFLAELTLDGEVVWEKFVEASPNSDAGFGILEMEEGGYMMTGYGYNASTNDVDIVASQLGGEGEELERRYFEFPGIGIGYDIKPFGRNSFVITGYVTDNGDSQYFLALDNRFITPTQEIENPAPAIHLFPNPVSASGQQIQIAPTIEAANVRIVNSDGRLVSETYFELFDSINLSGYERGIYWLSIQTKNEVVTRKIIVL